jgi:primosomal protein N' (replication factor Y)
VLFYTLFIIGSPLESFTYHSDKKLGVGEIVLVSFNNCEKKAVVLQETQQPDFETLDILSSTDEYFSQKQLQLANFISSYYICSLGDAFALLTPFQKDTIVEHSLDKELLTNKIKLSKRQQKAFSFLQKHPVSLLFGDTGSGKTEIYMEYFHKVLAEEKRAVFLMPEISLTPQMSKRLEEHFGEHFVMWHSKLTPVQKKKALQKVRDGSAKIIAGARSCLFLPVDDIGLIVVDEEHDESYKSASRPRYNARDIAIYMGKLYGANVVLGSATPSLSSYVKFPHFRLKGGHIAAKKEFVFLRESEGVSESVLRELKERVVKKEQSILFVPTRANFKHLLCASCGHTFSCAFCSVGMSLHIKHNALKCHYCNFTQAIPKSCPECSGDELVSSRVGTAEALKVVQEYIPEAKVEQFDRDAITTAKKLREALERFNNKEIDILVGTQMLSKGHDYHDVTFAAILGMDNLLSQGDYRAREKALSLLIQVAGRSGRAKDAKVLVQSFNEEFFRPYLENYEAFLEEEKLFREELYPPFKKLCRVLFAHKKEQKAHEEMRQMEDALRRFGDVEIVGAKKCAIERVAGKYRFEILLRADKSTALIKAVRSCKTKLAEVDMDPLDFV